MSMWVTNQIRELWRAIRAGTGATILYGTGDPPDPTGLADGTVYIKYVP